MRPAIRMITYSAALAGAFLSVPARAGIALERPKPGTEWTVGQKIELSFSHDRGVKTTHLKVFRFGDPKKVYLDKDVVGKGTNPIKVEFEVPKVDIPAGGVETIIVEVGAIQGDGAPCFDQVKVKVRAAAPKAGKK